MGAQRVLVIGQDPALFDFAQPGYAPGMDATKVLAGLESSEEELARLGYSVQMGLTDSGETAGACVRSRLEQAGLTASFAGQASERIQATSLSLRS